VFERLAPTYLLDDHGPQLDLDDVFAGSAPVVLDIGFGAGDVLIEMAMAQPELAVIGCDVHTPGIAAVLEAIEQHSLTNVRLVHGDALEFVERLQPQSLWGIRVFFPDPWPKVRHHHRRLVRGDVMNELVALVRPGGWFHVATDIDDYATQMQTVCDAQPSLRGGPIDRPDWRRVTRYEQKGLDAGRTVVDLWYEVAAQASS
jgi:tRNA (guanine-N7-)-methyltransferase